MLPLINHEVVKQTVHINKTKGKTDPGVECFCQSKVLSWTERSIPDQASATISRKMLSIVIIWNFIFQSLTNVQLQASVKLLISPWCEHRTMSSHPREPESPQSSLNSMSTHSNQCITMSEWVDKARQWSARVPIKTSYICEACGDCGLRGKYLRKCPFLGRAAAQVSWLRPKIMTISLPRMYFSATLRFNDVRVGLSVLKQFLV